MVWIIFFYIVIILLLLKITTWIIGLGYALAVVIDILVLGGFAIYYAHNEWFINIASGKAVYFWDVLLFALIGFIYGIIVMLGTRKFPRIAGIFHYVIAWIMTGFIYLIINYGIFDGLGSLLNNEQINIVIHIIIISILSLFIFNSRIRIFKQQNDF